MAVTWQSDILSTLPDQVLLWGYAFLTNSLSRMDIMAVGRLVQLLGARQVQDVTLTDSGDERAL